MMGIMSSFLGPTLIPEDLESVLVVATESAGSCKGLLLKKWLFIDRFMVSIMCSFLGPTSIKSRHSQVSIEKSRF